MTADAYDGDVCFDWTPDGIDLSFSSGALPHDRGRRNAIILSLFGNGGEDERWWGDDEEDEPQYRAGTARALRELPLVSSSLPEIEDQMALDLAWMDPKPTLEARIAGPDRCQLVVIDELEEPLIVEGIAS